MSGKLLTPDRVLNLMRSFTLTRGRWAGQPWQVFPAQEEWTRGVFALDEDGTGRQHNEAYIHVARKNTKSTTAAAWGVAGLTEEPGGEVIIVAAKREQAGVVFGEAKRLIRSSSINGVPLMEAGFVLRQNAIYYEPMDAVMKPISADAKKEHGLNPHMVIADEVHAWTDPELLFAMTTAVGARENPLIIYITTPGEKPAGIWHDLYVRGKDKLSGKTDDPRFYVSIHEADPGAELHDEGAMLAANPALLGDGIVNYDFLHDQADKLPEYVYRRLHLAQPTTAHERWLPYADWLACSRNPDIPEGAKVTLAFDAAVSRDTFGVAMVWLDPDTGEAHAVTKDFHEDGAYIDPQDVIAWILGTAQTYKVKRCGYDPAFAGLIASTLEDRGITMEPFAQTGTNMTRATETLQRFVLDHQLRHGDERGLSEQMASVGIKPTDRGVRISKGKSGGNIDRVVALAMALDLATTEPPREHHFVMGID